MKTTLGALKSTAIYMFVYGVEGSGKTRLAMTVRPDNPSGVGYITPERGGPTSLLTAGFPADIEVEVLDKDGNDPFPKVITAIERMTSNPKLHTICVDGCTGIAGLAIEHFSKGRGEKAMGYDGWGYALNGFRQVENAAEKAFRKGKSVIYTAWQDEPKYEQTLGGQQLKEVGRPYIPGKGRVWLPGNVDIIARITSKFVPTKGPDGKLVKKFQSNLQIKPDGLWLAKTRWDHLPDPCPADLKWILGQINKAA